tara:strand:- start:116 stop:265 length:150 start_codon:yes stop_codon:yes gene_type:complete
MNDVAILEFKGCNAFRKSEEFIVICLVVLISYCMMVINKKDFNQTVHFY